MSLSKIYWGLLVAALLPLILFWKFLIEPIAWLVDWTADFIVEHKHPIRETLIAFALAFGFLGAQIGVIYLILNNPEVKYAVDHYKRECNPCQ